MPDHLALADLFVGHVRADEFNLHRLPSKIPEYMAVGRPMLVADHGFGRELEEGTEAVKVTGDDPAELAAGIRRALAMRDDWPAMGEALRRKAIRLFDWDRNTDGLAAFYDELRRTPPVVAREGMATADPLTLVDLGYFTPRPAAARTSAAAEPESSGSDELSLEELAAAARSRVAALRDENLRLSDENRRLEAERKRLTEVLQVVNVQLRLLRRIPLVKPIWRLIRRLKYPHLASPGGS